ncbi:MAG: ribonuclease E/G [Lachnospiraceae bacterium]|nr:ribonuclease E/G [Lachnospiraceae bacterium]
MKNNNRIAITKSMFHGRELEILLYVDEHNHPIEFHSQSVALPSLVGNIYIARVSQVMEQLQAAFLQAGELKFYLPMEDISHLIFTKKQGNPNKLCQGDELVVQVVRDAIKTKEICVTGNITLGEEHVLITTGNLLQGVSKKLPTEMRKNLKEMLRQMGPLPYGVVVRTSAETVDMAEIQRQLQVLDLTYKDFIATMPHKSCGQLVQQASHPFYNHIKRLCREGCRQVITDSKNWFDNLKSLDMDEIEINLYQDKDYPMEKLYNLPKIFEDLQKKHVYLPSGGFLVIEPTEALTVVDVNSGKNTKKLPREEYFVANNREAAIEIAKQLRLRNISGMVVVDFINMAEAQSREQILSLLRSACKNDYVKVSVLDYTKLGLVEITREKKYQSVSEQLF